MFGLGIRICLIILSFAGLYSLVTMHFWGLLLYSLATALCSRFIPDIQQRYSYVGFNVGLSLLVLLFTTLGSVTYFLFESDNDIAYYYQLVQRHSQFNPVFFEYEFGLRHWNYYCGLIAFYVVSIFPLIFNPARFLSKDLKRAEQKNSDEVLDAIRPSSTLTAAMGLIAIFVLPWFFIHSDIGFDATHTRAAPITWVLWWALTIWFFSVVNAVAKLLQKNGNVKMMG